MITLNQREGEGEIGQRGDKPSHVDEELEPEAMVVDGESGSGGGASRDLALTLDW
jgi:hypothetical protein